MKKTWDSILIQNLKGSTSAQIKLKHKQTLHYDTDTNYKRTEKKKSKYIV